jgi:large subunit ribosomal protein L30
LADHSKRKIFVKWVRSGIGFPRRQKEMVASLGLGRLHQVVACPDTPQVRGLVQRIHHLVEVVDEPKPAAWLSVPEYTILPLEVVEKPALEAPVPKAEEGAAGEAGGAKPEPAPEKEKHKDEAATEPAIPKKAAKPGATKDKAKAGKGEEGKKTRKAEASKSHRPAKKTSKK